MTTNQTIDGVARELLEKALRDASTIRFPTDWQVVQLRALLDAPACKVCNDTKQMHEPGQEPGSCAACFEDEAAQPQGEPVAFTAVGVLRDDGDGGQVPEWILEGGTAELWAGAVLLVADEDQELCAEDGHCELYRAPAEQPAPVAVVLPEHRESDLRSPGYGFAKGWNTCLDEVTRLNSVRPAHANPPPGAEPSGTHHDNDGLDEMRKPK